MDGAKSSRWGVCWTRSDPKPNPLPKPQSRSDQTRSDQIWLLDRGLQPVPPPPRGVHLPGRLDDRLYGQVDVVRVDQPGAEAGVAGERPVDGALAQDLRGWWWVRVGEWEGGGRVWL